MIRILHASDTHILTNKRHDEYREVFQKIYDLAREQRVTHIVHTGDLFHSKLQLTPECVSLAVEFLRNLSDIAPVYMICGNHDCTVKNTKRLDSITPIVEAIKSNRIHYFTRSGEYNFGDVTFGAFSMLDPDNYPKVSDSTRLNIALYHGSISGVMTDSGYVIAHGDCDVDIFKGYDYALLGDIHQSNQKVDDEGRVRYCGSTIQQNFGETNDKGVMIWDIKDKNTFDVKHYVFQCPKPFITIELDEEGQFQDWIKAPKGSRIRLSTYHNLSVDRVRNAIDAAKTKFKPESVTFISKALTNKENLQKVSNLSRTMNLRDLSVQEEMMKEFLKQYNPDDRTLEKVYEMNRRINSQVEMNEEVGRNIKWKLKSIEWDNLFNYGEGNRIDFDKLNGVVGILGKNAIGKSACSIDSLMYTLFNTTSKNIRKNLNVINQNCDRGRGKAVLEIDGNEYTIERTTEKYTKKSKGVEITEAKTDVIFTGVDETKLTGLDRNDTDKIIRRYLGTSDDFMLTSAATQFSAQSFITEGSTNRKAILAKFLDLDIFEAKFKIAKSEVAEIKAILKKLENTDYDEEIKNTQQSIKDTETAILASKSDSEATSVDLNSKRQELFQVQSELKIMERDQQRIADLLKNKDGYSNAVEVLIERIKKCDDKLVELDGLLLDTDRDLNVNIEDLLLKKAKIDANNKNIDELRAEFVLAKQENKNLSERVKLLSEVPCGSEYSECKFIKNAHAANDKKPSSDKKLVKLTKSIDKLVKDQEKLDYQNVISLIDRYNKALVIKQKVEIERKDVELNIEKWSDKLQIANESINNIREQLNSCENADEISKLYSDLSNKSKSISVDIHNLEMKLNSAQQNVSKLYKDNGYYVSKLETLQDQKADLADKRTQFGVYDLYLKCMHPNGISYQVIKNKLPIINEEINKILANVVDFEVYLINDDDKLDIVIKYPKHDARPIEMGSGAEKSLASIAIRLAFLQVTSLPTSQFIVLDEPGTSLDADNLAGFIRILDLIKTYFKTVILISHLDILKDAVDMQIMIDRKGNFAYVNQ